MNNKKSQTKQNISKQNDQKILAEQNKPPVSLSKDAEIEAFETTNKSQNISDKNHSEILNEQTATSLQEEPLSFDQSTISSHEPQVSPEQTASSQTKPPISQQNLQSANQSATSSRKSRHFTAKTASKKINTQEIKSDINRLLLVILGGILLALNIVVFARTANLFPGGFTGISLLIQNIFQKYFNISVPYSAINYILNAIPIFIGIKYIGKKFTLFSVIMIFVSGIFTDLFAKFSFFHVTNDMLLCSVFGGIVNGAAISLCLFAGASSGGTDFISIFISEKTGKSAWNLIFAFNCCVLFTAGILFGWDKALYSIIFQFTSTQVINTLYKKYEKTTLLIITEKPAEIYAKIKELTNHAATVFEGRGEFSGKSKKMVYTVVSSSESGKLEKALRSVDPEAFINVLQSKEIIGRFFKRAND